MATIKLNTTSQANFNKLTVAQLNEYATHVKGSGLSTASEAQLVGWLKANASKTATLNKAWAYFTPRMISSASEVHAQIPQAAWVEWLRTPASSLALSSDPHLMSHISASAVGQFSKQTLDAIYAIGKLSGMNGSQLQSWTTHNSVASLSETWMGALSAAAINGLALSGFQALSTAQLKAISNEAFGGLNGIFINSMSSSTAKMLTLTAEKLGNILPTTFAELSGQFIAALSSSMLQKIQSAQLAKLPAAEFGKLSKTTLLSLTNSWTGITANQMSAWLKGAGNTIDQLGTNIIASLPKEAFAGVQAVDVKMLTAAQAKLLSASQVQYLGTAIAGLSTTALAAITADASAGFSAAQVGSLSDSQFRALSAAALGGLSQQAGSGLTAAQIAGLTTARFVSLSLPAIAGLTKEAMSGITDSQVKVMSTTQVAQLGAVLDGIRPDTISKMATVQWAALTATAISSLSFDQAAGMKKEQIAALSPDAVAGFSPRALMGLRPEAVSAFTVEQVARMSSVQTAALESKVGSLSSEVLKTLSEQQWQGMSDQAIRSLSLEQWEQSLGDTHEMPDLPDPMSSVPSNADYGIQSPDWKLLEKFRQPMSPYSAYNVEDRILNGVYRYWALNDGVYHKIFTYGMGPLTESQHAERQNLQSQYEAQTTLISQYHWMSTAILGVGYMVNHPDMYGPDGDAKTKLGRLNLARAIVGAGLESMLYVGNAYRYSPSAQTDPEYGSKVKLARQWVGATVGVGLTLNAIVGLGGSIKNLILAIDSNKSADIGVAAVSVVGSAAGFATNLTKTIAAIGTLSKWSDDSLNLLNIAGSAFGIANGLLGAIATGVSLKNSALTGGQRAVIAAEMSLQLGGGIIQGISNYVLAANLARNATSGASVVGPALGAALGAMMLAISPLEVRAIVETSKYANRLDELDKKMSAYGYEGDGLLRDLYLDKVKIDGGSLGTQSLLTLVGTTTLTVMSAMSTAAGPVGTIVGFVVGFIQMIVKSIQQKLLEELAEDYAKKIMARGGGP